MNKEQSKIRRFFKIARTIIAVAAVVFTLSWLFIHLGSGLVESLFKKETGKMGLASPQLDVRDLNLEKLDINNLSFGDKENPGFSIPFLSADFSLPALYKGSIKKVTLSGMVLKIEQTAKGWTFKGLDPLFKQQGEGKPVVIGDLTVNSSVIHLRYSRFDQSVHSPPDRGTVIPFQLNALYQRESNSYKISVSIHPFGDTIHINGELDPEKGNGKFNITADSLRL
ncbi:MAG: hypothetical protein GY757_37190, partial [bacterium]|nr:hypothetical protein [bacterium]